jgi:hypothetical protein
VSPLEKRRADSAAKAETSDIPRWRFLCLLSFLFVAGSVWAVDPHTLISQYGHTAWRIQDGYFGGQLTAVAQTADGYLWVGTKAGLLRFDGVRFVPWTPPVGQQLPSVRIWSLLAARDGSLWIGTNSGLSHWVNHNLINLSVQGAVRPIIEDRNGTVWFLHGPPLDRYEPLCHVIETTIQCHGQADGIPERAADLVLDAVGNSLDWEPIGSCPLAARLVQPVRPYWAEIK